MVQHKIFFEEKSDVFYLLYFQLHVILHPKVNLHYILLYNIALVTSTTLFSFLQLCNFLSCWFCNVLSWQTKVKIEFITSFLEVTFLETRNKFLYIETITIVLKTKYFGLSCLTKEIQLGLIKVIFNQGN